MLRLSGDVAQVDLHTLVQEHHLITQVLQLGLVQLELRVDVWGKHGAGCRLR